MYPPVSSPWGVVDARDEIARGVWSVSTPGHGGLWVDPSRRLEIPPSCRTTNYSSGGWFEEDMDWVLVVAALPDVAAYYAERGLSREQVRALLQAQAEYFGPVRLAALGVQA
jgi:Domain of unknown function (DUF7007)